MIRYKRDFDAYVHQIGRFTEAVIHVQKYIDILQDELSQLKRKLVSYKGNTLQLFNEVFYTYKIQFVIQDVYESNYSFIKGNTNKDIITIYVNNDFFIYTSKENLDVFNEFEKILLLLLNHELVHRGQYYRRKGDLINFYNFDGNNVDIEYLRNNQEIMAYALMYIESLRFSGIRDNQILDMLRTGNYIKSQALHINFYISEMKDYDIKVYKKFRKYIYEYLENPIKNDLKVI